MYVHQTQCNLKSKRIFIRKITQIINFDEVKISTTDNSLSIAKKAVILKNIGPRDTITTTQ